MKKKILIIIIMLALIGCLGYFYMSQSQKSASTPTSDTNTNKEKKQKEEIKKQIVKDDNQEPAQVTKEKETTSSSTTPNVTVTQMKDGTYSSSTHSGLEVGQITSMTLVGDQYITIKGSFVEMSADG